LLGAENISYLNHDSYYKDLTHLSVEERAEANFDHPHSLETTLLVDHVKQLRDGKAVKVPVYDFTTHSRVHGKEVVVNPKGVILIEGNPTCHSLSVLLKCLSYNRNTNIREH
jgi:uridine kinase